MDIFGTLMQRLVTFCLTSQIVLAPIMLGGTRPWAIAVLTILTGIGLLVAGWFGHVKLTRPIKQVGIAGALLSVWLVVQAAPIWPTLPAPFNASHLALYPTAFLPMIGSVLWLAGIYVLAAGCAQMRGDKFTRIIAWAVIIAAILQVALACLADIFSFESTYWFAKQAHLGDWTGSFANRNAFGSLMTIAAIYALYLFCAKGTATIGSRIDHAAGWIALALIFTSALFASHSRSAVLALAIALITFAIMLRPKADRLLPRITYPVMVVACVTTALIVIAMLIPDLGNRFAELARPDLIQRDDAWQTAIIAISHRPFTGFGPNAIALVMDHFATLGLNRKAAWFSSHNLWLDAALIFGIPATLAMAGFILYRLTRTFRAAENRLDRTLLISLAALIGIMSSIGWVASMPALILPFLSLLAALEARPKVQSRAASQYRNGPRQSVRPDPVLRQSPAD
ncbi:O-antigen ligase [Thalassospira sp. MBR-102]|jgi:O-antigen ligase|uniref:O-antigen ligase family protein n=1 Tax=Thalassospira sp. MBR-102 TaxID=3156466 RepID=UPI003394380F